MHTKPLTFQLPAPVAGSDWSYMPSQTDQTVIMAITATLTTDATVANRYPGLKMTDQSGLVYFAMNASEPQAASLAVTYSYAESAPNQSGITAVTGQALAAPLPQIWLQPGDTIGSDTLGLDASDQWSAIVIRFYTGERWKRLQWELQVAKELTS